MREPLALSTTAVAEKPPEAPEAKEATARRARLAVRIPPQHTSRVLSFLAITALLVGAYYLRTWGNRFGLPNLFHPDEQVILERAIAVMRTGDFNPHWFHYPSLYIYLQTISDIVVFLTSTKSQAQIENITLPTVAGPDYVQAGRAVTAIMGTLTVLVVYYIGRSLGSVRLGLAAAALLTFSVLHTVNSHYVTTDVPVTLFAALSFLASLAVLRTEAKRYYILAGLAAGLAASTKYNGAFVMVAVIAAHCFVAWRKRNLFDPSILLAVGGFAFGFLIGTPYALLDLPSFLKDFAFEIAHYELGQPGFEGADNWRWYLDTLMGSLDVGVLLLSGAGAVICLAKRRAAYFLLLAFPLVYFWWFSSFVVRFERNMVPLTPFMALLAAVFVDWLASLFPTRRTWSRLLGVVVPLILVVAAVVPPFSGIAHFNTLLSGKHPKAIAAEWANANLPYGSRIAVEHYGIPLDPNSFELVNVLGMANLNADWFIQQQFDYLVLSDGVWQMYYLEPRKYPAEIAAYDSVFQRFKLVKAVEISPPSRRLVSYPTIDVYHLPKIRIYQVSEVAK